MATIIHDLSIGWFTFSRRAPLFFSDVLLEWTLEAKIQICISTNDWVTTAVSGNLQKRGDVPQHRFQIPGH
jgi:hypothetical protein